MRAGRLCLGLACAAVMACSDSFSGGGDGAGGEPGPDGGAIPPGQSDVSLVFVSRQIVEDGSNYMSETKSMAGVGPYSRARPAAPGKLMVLEPDGSTRVLIDGADPSTDSLHLIDVNAPAVSYDGATIVFAGLPEGDYTDAPARSIGAWRLYLIDASGDNLRQLTFTDQDEDMRAWGGSRGYDDFDPVFLPDGRICFSSTRYPGRAHYSGVRVSNLYVVDADGTGLHRITAERNGADRPLVDPMTGKIVYARWWRNYRGPSNEMTTEETEPIGVSSYPGTAYNRHIGLTRRPYQAVGGPTMFRNAWHAATIAPDGSGLEMWGGVRRLDEANHVYGGAFSPDGRFYANYFPMFNMTEAAGFGGVRLYERGASRYQPVAGVTQLSQDYLREDPTSYGVFPGPYVTEPEILPDGSAVVSMAPDIEQDYGLYALNSSGELERLLDLPGTQELRARALVVREVPPVLPDVYRDGDVQPAHLLPPDDDGPYRVDGTFTFDALNVYFNAPVDTEIVSAPAVGSAGSIRFYLDHQRHNPGSFEHLDWPILLGELPVSPAGAVRDEQAPANLPLFEQLRTREADGYEVPVTGGPFPDGAAHVAGMNFARPGAEARCVGCHAGHTMIPVPSDPEDALWTNLAPGATVQASSARNPDVLGAVIDRRARLGPIHRIWLSEPGEAQDGQWVELTFPVPVTVRAVVLYNPRQGEGANSSLQVDRATVQLLDGDAGDAVVGAATVDDLALDGSTVSFPATRATKVRVTLDDVSGRFDGQPIAGLAEIEVIARGEAP